MAETLEERAEHLKAIHAAKMERVRTEWEATELFCVNCGKQPVKVEPGSGDYYVGPEYMCLSCEESFCLGA
jgi:hypothetical protein